MEPELGIATAGDGVRIAWRSIGSGRILIHLPGVPFSNAEAEWRIPALRRAYLGLADELRLIQFDGRGTGGSQRMVTDLSLQGHLRDIDAVVEAAAADQVVLLGFFHSVTHAITWAARHPDRVRGLILFGGATRGWDQMRGPGTQALLSLIERDWNTFAESAAHAWLGWPAGEEGRLAADWFRTSTSPAVAAATMQAASGVDVTLDAARVSCPVLVLHRADAQVIPIELSEELVQALPNGRLEILPGSSASLFFEEADRIVDRIVGFVRDPHAAMTKQPAARRRDARGSGGLSPREVEVLRLVAAGDSNGQIAVRLGLSINTIERHVVNVYRKIDARGRADATAWAIRNGVA